MKRLGFSTFSSYLYVMKILSIGDTHGTTTWKLLGDIDWVLETEAHPETLKYDYYVFVGDYVDSFSKTNNEIYDNLKEIIRFKELYPDKVILLWGNHDIQYLTSYAEHGCTGYRPEAYFDLHELFRSKRHLFQLAFQIKNYIWTHAGLTIGWYKYRFPYKSDNLADDLNKAFEENVAPIYDIGRIRGGWNDTGGPLWADKRETSNKPLKGYHQIVGHTRVSQISRIENPDGLTSVTYIDNIEYGNCEPYILNLEV